MIHSGPQVGLRSRYARLIESAAVHHGGEADPVKDRAEIDTRIAETMDQSIPESFVEKGLQRGAQLVSHFRALKGEGDVGLQEADLVAAVIALAFEAVAVERLAADQLGHRIGELDLAAGAGDAGIQMIEHLGLEDIAADDREGGGGDIG